MGVLIISTAKLTQKQKDVIQNMRIQNYMCRSTASGYSFSEGLIIHIKVIINQTLQRNIGRNIQFGMVLLLNIEVPGQT